jgi:hypothetical protein
VASMFSRRTLNFRANTEYAGSETLRTPVRDSSFSMSILRDSADSESFSINLQPDDCDRM